MFNDNINLEDAKFRYAIAWHEWKKASSEEDKRRFERIMDKAQNYFTWDEFQEFKKTLDGFEEFWAGWFKEKSKEVEEFIKNNS